jgi:glutaryl-CoA dehydrogenase
MTSMAEMNARRESLKIAKMARNLLGGYWISLEYPVIRQMMNLESTFTYEGADNVHTMVLEKDLTRINAFV